METETRAQRLEREYIEGLDDEAYDTECYLAALIAQHEQENRA